MAHGKAPTKCSLSRFAGNLRWLVPLVPRFRASTLPLRDLIEQGIYPLPSVEAIVRSELQVRHVFQIDPLRNLSPQERLLALESKQNIGTVLACHRRYVDRRLAEVARRSDASDDRRLEPRVLSSPLQYNAEFASD